MIILSQPLTWMPVTNWLVKRVKRANAVKANVAQTRAKKAPAVKRVLKALAAKRVLKALAVRKVPKALAARKVLKALAARKAKRVLAAKRVKKVLVAVTPETEPLSHRTHPVAGAGLGLRRALLGPLQSCEPEIVSNNVDFMEVAPENWINVGGQKREFFRYFTERFPFVCHGLSLSIGGPSPLDQAFIRKLRQFMDEYNIRAYSEHLSYCTDDGHLYDLMPIPFTGEAVTYVAGRIGQVQDMIGQRMAIENVSYYAAPGAELSEIDFINAVINEADCDLLLDVNNIYVNSVNHCYDPLEFLKALPGDRISYGHIAGHYNEAEDLIVDTHGADIIGDVWDLLDKAYEFFGVFPTLLERDFNIPPVGELLCEVQKIKAIQDKWSRNGQAENEGAKGPTHGQRLSA
jgi:uncharacterized protein (UPF0276 family)